MSALHIKRARTPAERARLAHEASIARRIAQPGVVQLVASREVPGGFDLAYEQLDAACLGDTPLPAQSAIATLLALTMTVHRLHQIGVAHRALTPDHVLLRSRDGRPVICGLGHAIDLSEALDDPRGEDITALLTLLATYGPGTSEWQKLVTDLRDRHRRGRLDTEAIGRALKERQDPVGPVATSPVAEPLENVRQRLTNAGPSEPAPNHRRYRGAVSKVAALIALVLGAAVFTQLHLDPGAQPAVAAPPACRPAAAGAAMIIDVDGDGCGDGVTLAGTTINVDDEQFTVGEAGDVLALGRWACGDRPTLALLRPSTGQLFTFAAWPKANEDLRPSLLTTMKGATALSTDTTQRCDRLRVTTPTGLSIVDPVTGKAA